MTPGRAKYLFVPIGLGMLAVAACLSLERFEFLRTAQTAQGVVIELVTGRDTDPGLAPRVSFLTPDGVDHEFSSNVYGSRPSFSIGEGIEVLYDPGNPSDAAINTFFQLWAGSLITGVIGLFFIFLPNQTAPLVDQAT